LAINGERQISNGDDNHFFVLVIAFAAFYKGIADCPSVLPVLV